MVKCIFRRCNVVVSNAVQLNASGKGLHVCPQNRIHVRG